jgi:hypothetical protein
MSPVAFSSAHDPVPAAAGWSFEEDQARWRAARTASIYSLRRDGDALVIHIPPPIPYDGLRYLVIAGPLSTERLRVEINRYKRFYPSILWGLARAFPKMLAASSGWRYLLDSATISRPFGDVRVSVPTPYITPFHTPGKPDPFGDLIIDRLATLQGRLFSAEELDSIIATLRIETLGPERFGEYLKGIR